MITRNNTSKWSWSQKLSVAKFSYEPSIRTKEKSILIIQYYSPENKKKRRKIRLPSLEWGFSLGNDSPETRSRLHLQQKDTFFEMELKINDAGRDPATKLPVKMFGKHNIFF